jgi:hypothetical protein
VSTTRTLLTVLAGAAAGIVGSLVVSRYTSSNTGVTAGAVSSVVIHAAASNSAPGVGDGKSNNPPPMPLSEQQRESLHAEHIARVRTEAVASPWAAETEATLRQALSKVSGGAAGFKVVGVECRSTSCLATVEWPSYRAAEKTWQAILHAQSAVACAREILLPRPNDPNARYTATAIFDCSAARDAAAP